MQHAWNPYCGMAPVPGELLGRWNLDPFLLLALAAAALTYVRLPCDRRGSPGAFAAAWLLAAMLFVSPFCALTSALFSARVTHHLLLAIGLAPLLVLAVRNLRVPGGVAVWTAIQAVTFWLWHAPSVYAAALASDGIYWAMQISLLATATGFWMSVRAASAPAAAGALLATMVQMGILGALITFAGQPVYEPHLATTSPWGLSALEDQQLAGLVMWAPGAGFYLAAAILLVGRWLNRESAATAAA